jgi:hypothetical protein
MATIDVPSVHMDLIVTTFFPINGIMQCVLFMFGLFHVAYFSFFFMDELHSLMWVK